jgi:hypothetical protein
MKSALNMTRLIARYTFLTLLVGGVLGGLTLTFDALRSSLTKTNRTASDTPAHRITPTSGLGNTPTSKVTISSPTIAPVLPDPRIKEFLDVYGVELADHRCNAPCRNEVVGSLSLGEFVKKFGVPDKVYLLLSGPENPYVIVNLIYIRRGIFVYASRPALVNSKFNFKDMTPDMNVDRIDLWRSHTLGDLALESDIPLEEAQDWSGFGTIKPIRR